MTNTPMRDPYVLGDRYELRDVVGHGGMAEVYRAWDRVLDREVAVKLLRGISGTPTDRTRFTEEARMLGRLSHPGLVTVLDASMTGDQPYLVMELVRGPNLADCCRGVALEPRRVAAIGAQLADALGYAHSAGIVHRDLKPENVLLAKDDRALLTDFGIARLMSEAARLTATGTTVGTAAYLAPEQVRGQEVTPATDVYSLGLVLLEALTGQRAYQGSPTEAALARLTTPPAIPPQLAPGWQHLLRAMTALEPAHRPTTGQIAATLHHPAGDADPVAGTATAVLQVPNADDAPTQAIASDTAYLPQPQVPQAPRRLTALPGSLAQGWRWIAASVAAAALVLFVVVLTVGNDPGDTETEIPPGVSPQLEQPLKDLHDAVEGRR